MQKIIKNIFGDNPQEAIKENRCVKIPIGCGRKIELNEKWRYSDIREYKISGLCNHCQKKIFG